MLRREFIKTTIFYLTESVIPASWSDKKVVADTGIRATRYDKETIIDMLLVGRKEFLKDIDPCKYTIGIYLMVKGDMPITCVTCSASKYSNFDVFDAHPDPGHINYRKMHPIIAMVEEFDRKFKDLKLKDLKPYRVFIKVREN